MYSKLYLVLNDHRLIFPTNVYKICSYFECLSIQAVVAVKKILYATDEESGLAEAREILSIKR